MRKLAMLATALALHTAAAAAPTSVLFVGNSYTFGRVDPVMSYNTANVRDLTAAMFVANPQGSNPFEPHPLGGVAGIFSQAFMRVVASGVATRNFWAPKASTDGLINLWFDDGTHASAHGSYLSALTLYGTLTGLNPLALGATEIAARDLETGRADAVLLQRIAAMQLGMHVPEPGSLVFAGLALAALLTGQHHRVPRALGIR